MFRNPDKAATVIQKHVRGHLARKRYQIKPLKTSEMAHYPTFVIGNDPVINDLTPFKVDDKIALIATSGLRAILLACQLSNPTKMPKIFIVDNSLEVCSFWHALRIFIANTGTEEQFNHNLNAFLRDNSHLYRHISDELSGITNSTIDYPNQNISEFFNWIFKKFKFSNIVNIIKHTSIIKQSWSDIETMTKIGNIVRLNNIKHVFMYPSNIVSCCGELRSKMNVLKSIAAINPTLSIHTVHEPTKLPEKVFLLQNQEVTFVRQTLFGGRDSVSDARSNLADNEEMMFAFISQFIGKKYTRRQ
jgi:hypothetical protein